MARPSQARMDRAVQTLAKWRVLLTGWQLGTRPKGEPEADAVRDHREASLVMRAELSALVGLLISHGVFTDEEWETALAAAADDLSAAYARRFPGITATEHGLNYKLPEAAGTMAGWKP